MHDQFFCAFEALVSWIRVKACLLLFNMCERINQIFLRVAVFGREAQLSMVQDARKPCSSHNHCLVITVLQVVHPEKVWCWFRKRFSTAKRFHAKGCNAAVLCCKHTQSHCASSGVIICHHKVTSCTFFALCQFEIRTSQHDADRCDHAGHLGAPISGNPGVSPYLFKDDVPVRGQ